MRKTSLRGPKGRSNLAVFCSGYGSNFQAIIDAIRQKKLNAEIAVMVCDNPKAYALVRARRNNIPVFLVGAQFIAPAWARSIAPLPKSREDYEKLIVGVLKCEKVDLVILAGFMRILTPYFINSYKNKILNIHPSLLPAFKGAHAIRDAFEADAKETGVTVHVVTADVDAGPIVAQKKVSISEHDTLESLEKKIHAVEHKLYPEAIGRVIASAQSAPRHCEESRSDDEAILFLKARSPRPPSAASR